MYQGYYFSSGKVRHLFIEPVRFTDVVYLKLKVIGSDEPFALFVQRTSDLRPWLPIEEIERMSKMIRQLIKEKRADTGVNIVAEDEWLRSLAPQLHELLTVSIKDQGKVYEPGGLFLYASCGTWCASFSNRELKFKRRGEGVTIEAAILDLENRLGKGEEPPAPTASRTRGGKNGQEVP